MADEKQRSYAEDFIKADIGEAVFLGHPMLDNLTTTVIALASEVWTNRRRQRIVEAMLAEGIAVTNESIEQFQPSEELEAQWQKERDVFIRDTFSSLKRATDSSGNAKHWADPTNKKES